MTLHRPLCPDGRAAQDEPVSAPCAVASRPYVLAVTILASAMGFIDGTVVTIALPAIQQEFQTSFATLQWIVNIYALLLGSLLLIGGSAGDLFGRRRIFLTGIGIFTVASIACALAPSAALLIASRALQGVGAALMIPQSLAIIAASFPKDVRGRAIGIWAGASAITTALGPALGGFLIDAFDWRTVFWINLPIAIVVLWLTWTHVPESRNLSRAGALDWLGGLLALVGFGALTLALTTASEIAEMSIYVVFWLAVGAIGLTAFLYVEHRAADPVMPLWLFRNPSFFGANLTTLLLYGSFSAVLFLLPFELIERRGYSASEVGLILLPIGLVIGIGSRIAGKWSDQAGPRDPLIIGSLTVAAAAGYLALNVGAFWPGVFAPVFVISAGMAIVVAPLTTAVMNSVPDAQSGAASGVNNAASRLAGLFAVAIAGSVAAVIYLSEIGHAAGSLTPAPRFGILPDAGSTARPVMEAAFLSAYAGAMLIAAGFGLAAAATAYATISRQRPD
ncbi:MAG: MFS transporter [Hyphomicrobiales bacterium]|nr:MFS transporter [Hyphomicrobiales bacterium]